MVKIIVSEILKIFCNMKVNIYFGKEKIFFLETRDGESIMFLDPHPKPEHDLLIIIVLYF